MTLNALLDSFSRKTGSPRLEKLDFGLESGTHGPLLVIGIYYKPDQAGQQWKSVVGEGASGEP